MRLTASADPQTAWHAGKAAPNPHGRRTRNKASLDSLSSVVVITVCSR